MPARKKSGTQAQGKALEAQLWDAADKMRINMDEAEYSRAERDRLPQAARRVRAEARINHVCLGLVFLRYLSAAFARKHAELLDTPHADAEDLGEPSGARQTAAGSPQGERGGANQDRADNVFWVPADACWSHLQASAEGKNGGMAKCEVRSANVEAKSSRPFGIRNSAFGMSLADIGKEHADTFRSVLDPELRADTATRGSAKPRPRSHSAGLLRSERQLLANPPFNDSDTAVRKAHHHFPGRQINI
jgi:hypothetical protein